MPYPKHLIKSCCSEQEKETNCSNQDDTNKENSDSNQPNMYSKTNVFIDDFHVTKNNDPIEKYQSDSKDNPSVD
jgi:hypothetical protein